MTIANVLARFEFLRDPHKESFVGQVSHLKTNITGFSEEAAGTRTGPFKPRPLSYIVFFEF